MAIDTFNKRLSLLEGDVWDAGLPLPTGGAFTRGERQQLLFDYPGVLYAATALQIPSATFTARADRLDFAATADRLLFTAVPDRLTFTA